MVLSREVFQQVLKLSEVDWNNVSEERRQSVVARCVQLRSEIPLIKDIEGVKKFSGGLYLYEQALTNVLTELGAELGEDTPVDLLIGDFLQEF